MDRAGGATIALHLTCWRQKHGGSLAYSRGVGASQCMLFGEHAHRLLIQARHNDLRTSYSIKTRRRAIAKNAVVSKIKKINIGARSSVIFRSAVSLALVQFHMLSSHFRASHTVFLPSSKIVMISSMFSFAKFSAIYKLLILPVRSVFTPLSFRKNNGTTHAPHTLYRLTRNFLATTNNNNFIMENEKCGKTRNSCARQVLFRCFP